MRSPFPGMDPYLEHPHRWSSIHTQVVARLPDVIEPLLPARYAISVDEHVYLSVPGDELRLRRPDVLVLSTSERQEPALAGVATLPSAVEIEVVLDEPIRESYLTIRDLEADEDVVTAIEVLSPTNKRPGPNRDEYMVKRLGILSSPVSLIEIDLLRGWSRMPARGAPGSYDYGIMVSRGWTRRKALLLPFSVRGPIPRFRLPLTEGEEEPEIDIAPVLSNIYERNRLHLRIDYAAPPEPLLSPEDEAWADALLREKGLR